MSPWSLRLQAGVHALALVPLVVLVLLLVGPGFGPDPAGWITRRLGDVALLFLVLSLVPGTLRRLTGNSLLMPIRRALGLYALGYATLHLLAHLVLVFGMQLGLLLASLAGNRFVLIGLVTYLLLLSLGLTSTAGWQRRLGAGWGRLHRAVYVAALLDVWHYAWSFKEWRVMPLLAAGLILLLLLVRIPRVTRILRPR